MERSIAPIPSFDPEESLKILPFESVLTNSPAARWSFLIAGILYGSARYNRLYKQEEARLRELEKTREERETKEKILKENRIKRELEDLESSLGIKF